MLLEKSRVSASGEIIPFELPTIEINEEGATNLYVKWNLEGSGGDGRTGANNPNTAEKRVKATWTGSSRLLKDCIERMLIEHGSDQQPFGREGGTVRAVHVDRVRDEFSKSYAAESKDAKRVAFKRFMKDATAKKWITTREIGASGVDWVWFTSNETEGKAP